MGNVATIPQRVDRETAKRLAGERFSAEIFDKFRDHGDTISRERLLELDKIVRPRPSVPLMTQTADPVLVSAIVPVNLPPSPSQSHASCESIVQSLKTHGFYANSAESGCKSLWSLAALNEANRVKLGGLGACETLLQALKAHGQVATVAEYACGALKTLTINSENQVRIGAAGGCETIVQILKSHGQDAGVLAQALEGVKALSHRNEPNKNVLISAGACETILETMKAHVNEERIAQYGCGAMINLAASSEGRQKFLNGGACDTLADVLRKHKTSVGICQYACWVLINLAADDAARAALGGSGACEATVEVLREHIAISGVTEYSCWAMVNLSANCAANRTRLCSAGAGEAALQALQNHPNNQGVATQVSRAVHAIAASAENKLRLIQSGAIPLLTAIGDNDSYSFNTRERAKEAVSRLL